MSSILIRLGQAVLSGIGLVWLFLAAYYSLGPDDAYRLGFLPFLVVGLAVGAVWFAIDGFLVTGFLRRSIVITSNAIDAEITVVFGDLFAQDGCKAISVNDFFDSAVDEKHVASSSLHGKMLTDYWGGNTVDWDEQVARDLASTPPVKVVTDRPTNGKLKRYAVGTTASVSKNGQNFLCVALTTTCIKSLEVSATSDDLQHAVRG